MDKKPRDIVDGLLREVAFEPASSIDKTLTYAFRLDGEDTQHSEDVIELLRQEFEAIYPKLTVFLKGWPEPNNGFNIHVTISR